MGESKEAGHKGALRTISRTTSPDFIHWSEPVAMKPNLPGEHLYTNQTTPYFRAPHLYIALPTRYTAGRVGAEKAISMLGSTDILLMTTRAGSTHYDRLFTEAFIRPGLKPSGWESRANYMALNLIPTSENEMSLWHGKTGRRYALRTDGFVSARAGAKKGELLTKPIRFSGSELVLNFSTAAAGRVQVELQDERGTPIPGFKLGEGPPMVGDKVAQVVRWGEGADLAEWIGKPVRLRWVLQEADLFSFQFRDPQAE